MEENDMGFNDYMNNRIIENALLDSSMTQIQHEYNRKMEACEAVERDLTEHKNITARLEAEVTALKLRQQKYMDNIQSLKRQVTTLRSLDQAHCLRLQTIQAENSELIHQQKTLISKYKSTWQLYQEEYEKLGWVQDIRRVELDSKRLAIQLKMKKQKLYEDKCKSTLLVAINYRRLQIPIIELAQVWLDVERGLRVSANLESQKLILQKEVNNLKETKINLSEELAKKTRSNIDGMKFKRVSEGIYAVHRTSENNSFSFIGKGQDQEKCQFLNFNFSSRPDSAAKESMTIPEKSSSFLNLPRLPQSLRSLVGFFQSDQHTFTSITSSTECQGDRQSFEDSEKGFSCRPDGLNTTTSPELAKSTPASVTRGTEMLYKNKQGCSRAENNNVDFARRDLGKPFLKPTPEISVTTSSQGISGSSYNTFSNEKVEFTNAKEFQAKGDRPGNSGDPFKRMPDQDLEPFKSTINIPNLGESDSAGKKSGELRYLDTNKECSDLNVELADTRQLVEWTNSLSGDFKETLANNKRGERNEDIRALGNSTSPVMEKSHFRKMSGSPYRESIQSPVQPGDVKRIEPITREHSKGFRPEFRSESLNQEEDQQRQKANSFTERRHDLETFEDLRNMGRAPSTKLDSNSQTVQEQLFKGTKQLQVFTDTENDLSSVTTRSPFQSTDLNHRCVDKNTEANTISPQESEENRASSNVIESSQGEVGHVPEHLSPDIFKKPPPVADVSKSVSSVMKVKASPKQIKKRVSFANREVDTAQSSQDIFSCDSGFTESCEPMEVDSGRSARKRSFSQSRVQSQEEETGQTKTASEEQPAVRPDQPQHLNVEFISPPNSRMVASPGSHSRQIVQFLDSGSLLMSPLSPHEGISATPRSTSRPDSFSPPNLQQYIMSPIKTPNRDQVISPVEQVTPMFNFGSSSSILSPLKSVSFLNFERSSHENEPFNLFGSSAEENDSDSTAASNFFKLF